MLKKWLDKMLPARKQRLPLRRQRLVPLAEHGIEVAQLSFAAEKVLKRLHQAGFDAYVVGGAVRDLLLGLEPKDYDVATNATPEQVHQIFRRSRIIGRRFRIVHVMVGPETIEVTTFRGGQAGTHNEHGRIMKDNSYGSQAEDALRRDFTCNALYYDPVKQVVVDYHNGLADVQAKRLVMIGDAAERYREDPIRILRAVRLAGKLGFDIDGPTAAPIQQYAGLIAQEPVARLFDEILKLLFSGNAAGCLKQWAGLSIAAPVHPLLAAVLTQGQSDAFVAKALHNTDERMRAQKPVSVGFVLAAVLWPQVRQRWQAALAEGMRPQAALNQAVADTKAQMEGWGVPHRFAATMREIWLLQTAFDQRRGVRPFKLLAQPRFRADYVFLLLRAQTGEVDAALGQWWTDFQAASDDVREQMVSARAPASSADDTLADDAPADAPKKRRRRRRKKPQAPEAAE